jgi:hypothetical protein
LAGVVLVDSALIGSKVDAARLWLALCVGEDFQFGHCVVVRRTQA